MFIEKTQLVLICYQYVTNFKTHNLVKIIYIYKKNSLLFYEYVTNFKTHNLVFTNFKT